MRAAAIGMLAAAVLMGLAGVALFISALHDLGAW